MSHADDSGSQIQREEMIRADVLSCTAREKKFRRPQADELLRPDPQKRLRSVTLICDRSFLAGVVNDTGGIICSADSEMVIASRICKVSFYQSRKEFLLNVVEIQADDETALIG